MLRCFFIFSAVFEELTEDWKKKEDDYLKKINDLERNLRKTETEKVQEYKQQVFFSSYFVSSYFSMLFTFFSHSILLLF